jgi:hypothetical protein
VAFLKVITKFVTQGKTKVIDFMKAKFPQLITYSNNKMIPEYWTEDTYTRGQKLMIEGDTNFDNSKFVQIILSGSVAVYKYVFIKHPVDKQKNFSKELKVFTLGEGDIIGEDFVMRQLEFNQNPDVQVPVNPLKSVTKSIIVESPILKVYKCKNIETFMKY